MFKKILITTTLLSNLALQTSLASTDIGPFFRIIKATSKTENVSDVYTILRCGNKIRNTLSNDGVITAQISEECMEIEKGMTFTKDELSDPAVLTNFEL